MSTVTTAISLISQDGTEELACRDPRNLYAEAQRHGWETDWFGKANKFTTYRGSRYGEGAVLLTSADFVNAQGQNRSWLTASQAEMETLQDGAWFFLRFKSGDNTLNLKVYPWYYEILYYGSSLSAVLLHVVDYKYLIKQDCCNRNYNILLGQPGMIEDRGEGVTSQFTHDSCNADGTPMTYRQIVENLIPDLADVSTPVYENGVSDLLGTYPVNIFAKGLNKLRLVEYLLAKTGIALGYNPVNTRATGNGFYFIDMRATALNNGLELPNTSPIIAYNAPMPAITHTPRVHASHQKRHYQCGTVDIGDKVSSSPYNFTNSQEHVLNDGFSQGLVRNGYGRTDISETLILGDAAPIFASAADGASNVNGDLLADDFDAAHSVIPSRWTSSEIPYKAKVFGIYPNAHHSNLCGSLTWSDIGDSTGMTTTAQGVNENDPSAYYNVISSSRRELDFCEVRAKTIVPPPSVYQIVRVDLCNGGTDQGHIPGKIVEGQGYPLTDCYVDFPGVQSVPVKGNYLCVRYGLYEGKPLLRIAGPCVRVFKVLWDAGQSKYDFGENDAEEHVYFDATLFANGELHVDGYVFIDYVTGEMVLLTNSIMVNNRPVTHINLAGDLFTENAGTPLSVTFTFGLHYTVNGFTFNTLALGTGISGNLVGGVLTLGVP